MKQTEQQLSEEQLLQIYEEEERALALQQGGGYNSQIYNAPQKQNLVEWQLDFKSELEAIERALRCDVLSHDKDGNQVWIPNPDKSKIFMNSQGVNDVLRTIVLLINKGKVLSNYGADEIKPRVKMMMNEIRTLIYNNYEEYGIDNSYKMNNYSIMVLSIGSMIEDAYRRPINGLERKDLNQARVVQQNEPLMQQPMYGVQSQASKKSGSWYKPWTWV